jgi:hypothetical protein
MTYVYKLSDRDDRLLYVGIAERVLSRMKQHEATKSWWAEVERIDFFEYGSREAAVAAERTHIRTLLPLYNVSERPTDDEVWEFLCDMDPALEDWLQYGEMFEYQARLDGGQYCAQRNREWVAHLLDEFIDEKRDDPAFVAPRVLDVAMGKVLATVPGRCDPLCACNLVDVT